jgi:beta-1,4-mannosyltransferase
MILINALDSLHDKV